MLINKKKSIITDDGVHTGTFINKPGASFFWIPIYFGKTNSLPSFAGIPYEGVWNC